MSKKRVYDKIIDRRDYGKKQFYAFGIEFETHLFIELPYGEPYKRDKNFINKYTTIEYVDLTKVHDPPFKECYGIELTVDQTGEFGCLSNLEFQMGPYRSLKEFNEDFESMKKDFMNIVKNKKTSIDGKEYDVFTDNIDSSRSKILFDKNPYSETSLPSIYTRNGHPFGYVKNLTLKGITQLTFTIQIKYIPQLFKIWATRVMLSPIGFINSDVYFNVYNQSIMIQTLTKKDDEDTLGFIMYLLYYCKIRKEYPYGSAYFKAWFSIKPRTNFGSLFHSLKQESKEDIKRLVTLLKDYKPMIDKESTFYLFIEKLEEIIADKKLFYIKNHKKYRDGFYDLEENFKMENPDVLVEEVPYCCLEDHKPNLNEPLEILEWNSKEIDGHNDTVSIEYRKFDELLRISIRREDIDKDDKRKLSILLDKSKLNIDDLDLAIDIISRNFFDFLNHNNKHDLLPFPSKEMIQLKIDNVDWEFDMTGEVTYENEFMGFNRTKNINDYFSDIQTKQENFKEIIEEIIKFDDLF